MAVEIELKARLDDPEPVKQRLSALGVFCRSYQKNDSYWLVRNENVPASGVRVRRERGVDAEGASSGQVLVTFKTKEMRGQVEVNDEREFALASYAGAAVFEDLLARLDFWLDIKKEKNGWAWELPGKKSEPPVLAELSLVTGLGWFLELEILAENHDEETIAKSRKRLLELLDTLGIARNAIEERPYTGMLRL